MSGPHLPCEPVPYTVLVPRAWLMFISWLRLSLCPAGRVGVYLCISCKGTEGDGGGDGGSAPAD